MAVGMKSINNVVDISNIVMLETGQPLHFYDLDAIPAQEITVKDQQRFDYTALDGESYHIEEDDIVITTEGKPIGIAGIMGGDHYRGSNLPSRIHPKHQPPFESWHGCQCPLSEGYRADGYLQGCGSCSAAAD